MKKIHLFCISSRISSCILHSAFCILIASCILITSCTPTKKTTALEHPNFSGDSAYSFIEQQLAFGPRVPNSASHSRCLVWLTQQLRSYGFDVTVQRGAMLNYAGQEQLVLNIIASRPSHTAPVLLAAHYDTRPWTDSEEEYDDRFYNVPGADDGASGVAVLLEIARQIATDTTHQYVPVEIVFFDCEDMGTPEFYTGPQLENTWCLGSQLFALNNTKTYQYGIVLDMVGAHGAQFPREYFSMQYADNYQERIWRQAKALGYGRYFVDELSMPITDDHYYLNLAGIPTVDIIHYDARTMTGFGDYWHTRNDNINAIDKATLQAVGEVVLSCLNY